MLRAILNKPWKQRPTKQQLYGHLSPISQTTQDASDMLGTAKEVRTNSLSIFSSGLQHIGTPVLADQQKLISSALRRH